ncbi:branched-chain amino acid ABC transporter permease [Aureimonas sp. SA4125]|uniref:urea ABC transporter permease subunit UrtB n=1 Tax=Aureimonas sp. SA4125 TaxID=2826993 RepID=UPI001CC82CF7|nr:urea ABC transporter permease subunit UrtB [Aureimonas sp. SA4125]BDA85173.1 branched-chain amino acid ABC transporter permease [Aureimonas sp. SA4125]
MQKFLDRWGRLAAAVFLIAVAGFSGAARAQGTDAAALDRPGFVAGLCGGAGPMAQAIAGGLESLAAASPEDVTWMAGIVAALGARQLRCVEPGGLILTAGAATDAVTGATVSPPGSPRTPVLNLRSRGAVENLEAALTLLSSRDAPSRQRALALLSRRPDAVPPTVFARATDLAATTAERDAIAELSVIAALSSPDMPARLAAIAGLAAEPNRRTLLRLETLREDPAYGTDTAFRDTVDAAIADSSFWVKLSSVLSVAYNGISYASILFIAALGLAVIFGLMGVINLAQGEFIMLGAYTAFMVQEGVRSVAPGLIDFYLIIAVPFVFLVTALLGILVEATIVRHLYRRPLMTLLATWAVSLFLINLVRVTFGTQNLQFVTPSYVTGGFTLVGDFIVTYNRLFAIVFAAAVLALAWFVLQRTGLGLNIRTVTQNRDMAGCIGIPTRRVDRLAFGLGSGLAGLAGLALAPIYNVNPLMGTNFIIESFMVVVLGGVGTIGGTLIASLGIGQINVMIEPLYGAVAAKVIVLLLIIAFIQWRPEGLFPAPGRRK